MEDRGRAGSPAQEGANAMSKVKVTETSHGGWTNCIHITDGKVELVVTADVGPRIVRYGFVGGPNHLKVFDHEAGLTGGDEWRSYGGHRLWHAPEERPRTYDEDNFPIEWKKIPGGVWTRSKMDDWTQIDKEIEIVLDPETSDVQITHRLVNRNAWEISLAVWAITVVAPGGREIIPEIVEGPELLPNRSVALWTYSRMNDPRVTWGARYHFLDEDSAATGPFKMGLPVEAGWAAYANHGQLFVKRFEYDDEAEYPDFGLCSYETYTNAGMLEMETLSPMWDLEPGDSADHVEVWSLHDGVKRPATEEDVVRDILPLIG
jgi:hypothetical protein